MLIFSLAYKYIFGCNRSIFTKSMTYILISVLSIILTTLIIIISLSDVFYKLITQDVVNIGGHIQINLDNISKDGKNYIESRLNAHPKVLSYYYGSNNYTVVSNRRFSSLQGVYFYGLDILKSSDKIQYNLESFLKSDKSNNEINNLNIHNDEKNKTTYKINNLNIKHNLYSQVRILEGSEEVSESGILLGVGLAKQLQCRLGDQISVIGGDVSYSAIGAFPLIEKYNIEGIFISESDMLNNFIIISHLDSRLKKSYTKENIYVYMTDPYARINNEDLGMSNEIQINHWTSKNTQLVDSMNVEKNIMYIVIILTGLICSCFCIAFVLLLMNEKSLDMVLLYNLGMSKYKIITIFYMIVMYLISLSAIVASIISWIFLKYFHIIIKFISNASGYYISMLDNLNLSFSFDVMLYLVSAISALNFIIIFVIGMLILNVKLNLFIRRV